MRPLLLLSLWALLTACGISQDQEARGGLETDTITISATNEAGGVVPHPAGVPFRKSEIELGQMLFYSTALSSNGKVSCATCHNPALSFTDGVARGTTGVKGVALDRSAPAIVNLAWADSLFWDGRARGLEHQAFGPITNPNEMGLDSAGLVPTVAAKLPVVKQYMQRLYGDEEITKARLMRAIAQYERSLVSTNSVYDRYRRRERGHRVMPDAMARGFMVFNVNCESCHSGDNFTDNKFHNVGLDPWPSLTSNSPSLALYRVTRNKADVGKYRTPGLRNIGLTAPYMHDGRFATLAQVVDFYANKVVATPNLATEMRDNEGKPGRRLSDQDKSDLLVFLASLTDTSFVEAHRADGVKAQALAITK